MRSPGIVLWRRIATALAREVADGALRPGERLPPEAALAGRFGVNRHTLRRAVAELAAEGVLSVQQGRGTFVLASPRVEYRLGPRTRFSEIVSAQSRLPEGELLDAAELAADARVAAALELPEGAGIVRLEILRRVDGVPVSLSTSCLPLDRFRGIERAYAEARSLTAALAALGVTSWRRRHTRIWARLPTCEEGLALRQPMTAPLLVTEALDEDAQGRPIEFGVSRAAGERLQILVQT